MISKLTKDKTSIGLIVRYKMEDKELNQLIENEVQDSFLALHKEIIELHKKHDEEIKSLKNEIKGLRIALIDFQMQSGVY